MILYLYILATDSIPLTISAEDKSAISGNTIPIVVVFLLASPLATALGVYLNFLITSWTRSLVSSFTFGLLLTTLDTVAIDTFASFATSYIVIVIVFLLYFLFFDNF